MSAFPRTLFVLKHREGGDYGHHPYHNHSTEDWGHGDGSKRPLSSGLFNSARMVVEMLEHEGVPVKLVHVPDNNFIHRELVAFKADVVVIEAFWVVPEKFDELRRVCPNVKFVIRNHSETPFLANEGIAFDWMLEYVKRPNVIMTCNAPRMFEETKFLVKLENPHWSPEELHEKVDYLPNYYPTRHVGVQTVDSDSEWLDVGCFGAIRPLKNHMEQAVAALKVATRLKKRLRFHINGGRIEGGGDPILKNLYRTFDHYPQHKLINHRWMPHDQFKAVVASMDIVSQVSFSETFNIVAADAVVSGVATVTSSEVPWASRFFRADPTDSNEIAEVMERAYYIKKRAPRFNPSLRGLRTYNRQSTQDWLKFLHKLAPRKHWNQ